MSSQETNRIHKVALIGASGQIGSVILKSLIDINKHKITILARPESKASFPASSNVQIAKVDYASESNMVSALRGHDFLIITLSTHAPPTLHSQIVNAAAKAGVQWIMPNYWAFALGERGGTMASDPMFSSFGKSIDDVRNVSATAEGVKPHFVALCNGFWYEFSLAMGEPWFGFDIKNRRVTLYDEGAVKISTSTWDLCGKAVAALVSLPVVGANGEVSLEEFRNNGATIASFLISQRDMLDSLNRVLGTKDTDWAITKQSVKERYHEGLEQLHGGDRLGFAKAMYAKLFFPGEGGDYETGYTLDNERLGLPKEDLDQATRRAVEMVKNGMGIH
ncbi:CipA protein [Stagonosporopsis vannaccii]|nr:CipA protein [Stagonosporopsis vannaccii]